ncbi:hypothetical protein ACM66B_000771 [Microbotryomycetes sp. NB124-2]
MDTRALYDGVNKQARWMMSELVKQRRDGQNAQANNEEQQQPQVTQANFFACLLRLRQLCLHPDLVPMSIIEALEKTSEAQAPGQAGAQMDNVDETRMQTLQKTLRQLIDDLEECSICLDVMQNSRILPCSHAFCRDCILEVLKTATACPMDRRQINADMLIEYVSPPAEPEGQDSEDLHKEGDAKGKGKAKDDGPVSSVKIDQLLRLLQLSDPDVKSLVFSQFTGFLDLIEPHLTAAGISFCRFDGSMSQQRRARVINKFQTPIDLQNYDPSNPRVMLISLKRGSLGLNLTAASTVYLLDCWWQSSIESQALNRVYRIGQKRDVRVFQIIAQDTIENRVLEVQARKNELVAQAFAGTKGAGSEEVKKKTTRTEDLRELFAA